ncbi:MAG: hypothetical protein B7Z55_11215 [Planctomycetales bacterium 12-60-4]|nr:MAG: hypothetical protein B7Z55_11215 [Planctomycetales bacterium 12-60-4]
MQPDGLGPVSSRGTKACETSRLVMIPRIALFVARWALTAWIGAAVLFVVVGIREVTSPDLSSEVKDRLATLRFPFFYAAGFGLVGVTWLAGLFCRVNHSFSRRRQWLVLGLVTIALVGMAADYISIYCPLAELVTPPGKPRTQQFMELHRWSARVNTVNLLLCMAAATLLNWPVARAPVALPESH